MSAGRHTSGPWQSKHDYTRDGACTIIANVDCDTDASGDTYSYDFICTCEDEFGELAGNAEANARLIRQAPAYAAATQPVVDNLVGQDDTPDDDFIPVRAGDLRALNEAHLKAIGQ